MLRIAVYSLCRDRLDYTKICLASLQEKAGIQFNHLVVDNGSTDGTQEWLQKEYCASNKKCILLSKNHGISKASNIALNAIFASSDPDIVVKFDNDCLVKSENILGQIVEIYKDMGPYHAKFALSPRVEGIARQPTRANYFMFGGRRIGQTGIIGGLFHCVPASVYKDYRYPENLPLAKGQDDHFCDWFRKRGGEVGYIEGLVVEHYEGTNAQALRYPEYFKRKFEEEKLIPVS